MKKIITLLLLLILPYSMSQKVMAGKRLSLVKKVDSHLSIENKMLNVFVEHGVDTLMAKILVAQASHESGRFKNPLTKRHKNVFSIMHYSKRETLSLGGYGHAEGRDGYCSYASIDSSSVDMLMYMKFRNIPRTFKSITVYSKFLKKKGYYEADEKLYAKAVYAHYKQIWLENKD
mgnify:FL=1